MSLRLIARGLSNSSLFVRFLRWNFKNSRRCTTSTASRIFSFRLELEQKSTELDMISDLFAYLCYNPVA